MNWHFTEDPEVFRGAAQGWLETEAVRNTLLLTQLDAAGTRGWWVGPRDPAPDRNPDRNPDRGRGPGRVAAACQVLAAERLLVLGAMPAGAARELAGRLPGEERVDAVRGESEAVEAYAAARGGPSLVTRRMRLFRLGALTPPDPAPPGRERVAGPGDVPQAAAWMREFARDIGEDPDADYTPHVEARVREGRLRFWEVGGEPVAMASVSRLVAGQARVSPVYTPPAHRARGYAGAVTAAVSRAALDAGAAEVLLFADLANPTSNALYQRLGYRPAGDHATVAFGQRVAARADASRASASTRSQSRASRAGAGSIQVPPTQETLGRAR